MGEEREIVNKNHLITAYGILQANYQLETINLAYIFIQQIYSPAVLIHHPSNKTIDCTYDLCLACEVTGSANLHPASWEVMGC